MNDGDDDDSGGGNDDAKSHVQRSNQTKLYSGKLGLAKLNKWAQLWYCELSQA